MSNQDSDPGAFVPRAAAQPFVPSWKPQPPPLLPRRPPQALTLHLQLFSTRTDIDVLYVCAICIHTVSTSLTPSVTSVSASPAPNSATGSTGSSRKPTAASNDDQEGAVAVDQEYLSSLAKSIAIFCTLAMPMLARSIGGRIL